MMIRRTSALKGSKVKVARSLLYWHNRSAGPPLCTKVSCIHDDPCNGLQSTFAQTVMHSKHAHF
jgi:hypothetical protein